jgi:hypothetical protein
MARSSRRQFVLIGPPLADPRDAAAQPLGSLRDILTSFARFNTAPDGSTSANQPTLRLHGPGMVIELATAANPVTQAMASVHDESIAWPVLERACKSLGWRLMDMESGRVMAFAG